MDTETYPSGTGERVALSQRLAALATDAVPSDEPDLPVGPVLAASLTGLRAEIRGMRADLDATRAAVGIGAVAPDIADGADDAIDSRLASIEDSLEGLAERFESLARNSATDAGARLATIEQSVNALAERFATLTPGGTSGATVDHSDRLAAIETNVSALGAGLNTLQPAPPVDHREHLASIESSVNALSERVEALSPAADAGDGTGGIDDRVAAIAQSLQAERTAAAQHRERSSAAMQDQAAALDEWAEAVRGGLEDLGEAVTSSLGSLSTSVTTASTTGRDSERRHVEALINELGTTIEQGLLGVHDRMEAYTAPLDGRLEDLHSSVLDGFGGARTRLVEELSGTIGQLEAANVGTREDLRTELTELRADLADALDEMREKIEATVAGHSDTVHHSLVEHQSASEGLREGIVSAALTSKDSGARIAGLQDVVSRLDGTLSDLQSDWRPQVDAVVAQGRAAAQGVLEDHQRQSEATFAEMRTALRGQSDTIDNVAGSLGGSSERLIAAGQALLAYLGERDRWLERERDRVLHEVLDEFAQGLSAKERRAVSSRMTEALDRRRDARDAERFRRTEAGQPAIEIPPVPPGLAELGEPVVPVIPTKAAAPRRAPAKKSVAKPAAPAAKKSTPATKTATKTAAKTVAKTAAKTAAAKPTKTTKATPAKTTAATPATKIAAKTATKTAAKTATKTATKTAAATKAAARRTTGSKTSGG